MKAMILAAGLGTRMGALTRTLPKPLLAVNGRPLIVHLVTALAAAGLRELVINLAYRGEQIESALGDGAALGVRIDYSREPDGPLGTGGGVLRALPLLGPAPFVLVNADVHSGYPFAALPHRPAGLAHLVLVDNPEHNPQGDFVLAGDARVANTGARRLTFAGISVIDPALLADHTGPDSFSLIPPLRAAADRGLVSGEHYRGPWLDVGTPQRLAAAQQPPC
jgi:MurNAc alpha-1-phosphate uridylyltransferase